MSGHCKECGIYHEEDDSHLCSACSKETNTAAFAGRLRRLRFINQPDSNFQLYTCDEVGPGGAYHQYRWWCLNALLDGKEVDFTRGRLNGVNFQKGGIQESGVNGITNELLLEIVKDRLQCFQSGPFPCPENQQALHGVDLALTALYERTENRKIRGVEGKSEA